MRDPHVVALHYRLEIGPQLAFNDPEPVERETGAFTLRLADGQLRVEMKDHFAAVDAACLEVDQYLRSWEIATALRDGPGAMHFKFERPELIDRDPPPPGASVDEQLQNVECVATAEVAWVVVTSGKYPNPPDTFKASPNVMTMWGRYEGFLAGREPLLSMAYMCLTVLEASSGRKRGKRAAAAKRYGVHFDVLKTLGTLSTERGDAFTARKAPAGGVYRPLSDSEAAWVKDVVRVLIRRVGEWEADHRAERPQITMGGFAEAVGG